MWDLFKRLVSAQITQLFLGLKIWTLRVFAFRAAWSCSWNSGQSLLFTASKFVRLAAGRGTSELPARIKRFVVVKPLSCLVARGSFLSWRGWLRSCSCQLLWEPWMDEGFLPFYVSELRLQAGLLSCQWCASFGSTLLLRRRSRTGPCKITPCLVSSVWKKSLLDSEQGFQLLFGSYCLSSCLRFKLG